jgi:pyridoxamine 5'-phosphate oxidase
MSANAPIALFQEWFAEAKKVEKDDPTAMALATCDAQGNPAVRMVLLKAADERGFVFYTNLDSPKAQQLKAHTRAALCFHWATLEQQVRVEGAVEPVSAEEADAYFASRPRLSQLGAWASKQSQPIAGRWVLEQAVAATALKFPFGTVPRPENWSGYRVKHDMVEFWHQRPFRHHDRQRFKLVAGVWQHEWLFP